VTALTPTGSPRVTVGMPVYNGERYLEQALESVLGQTHTDFELLISDNASTDATERICRAYAARDPRVKYMRRPQNLGAAPNYNLLVDMARGEYFRWAAHDDLAEPALLQRLVAALDAAPDAVLAFSDTTLIDEDGEATERYVHRAPWRGGSAATRLEDLLRHDESYIHRCFPVFGLMRTDALRRSARIGAFEGADNALLVELALSGDFIRVPEYLFARREHARSSRRAQVTARERARWFSTAAAIGAPMVRTTLARRYVGALRRARMRRLERLRCWGVMMRWFVTGRRWRVIAGECRAALTTRLTSRRAVLEQ